MDKCKLCGEHPSSYVFDGVTRYHCAKKFKENSCPNSRTDFTPEQWAALMGKDQDAVRYRWLRERERTGEFDTDGLFIGVDSKKHIGRWALYGKQADKAIDAAMAKEQDGEV